MAWSNRDIFLTCESSSCSEDLEKKIKNIGGAEKRIVEKM
jgi:hypothetical protein